MMARIVTMIILFGFIQNAHAYVGPGLGVGSIIAVIGIIGSIFLGLFAILYYPIKRFFKNRRADKKSDSVDDEHNTD